MALPFDLEDVVGAALADLLKRFVALWSCLIAGTVMAGTALIMVGMMEALWYWITRGWSIGGFGFPDPGEFLMGLCFGFFIGLATLFGVFYGAFLIGLAIYFFRADEPHPYVWVIGAGVVALNVTGPAWGELEWLSIIITIVILILMVLGLMFLARIRLMKVRVRAEEHLMGIAVENEERRRETQERTGGAVADREFALGDQADEDGAFRG